METAEIGIIGGSGLYDPEMLEDKKEIKVYTPYGKPSDFIITGYFKGRKIAFISRHGRGHQSPAHLVNYRANIWALKELGVSRILASNACGSLQEKYKPGDLAIIDQFIDRTKSRASTFYEGGKICHISVADPFCDELRTVLAEQAKKLNLPYHSSGTYVCIEGPRFSTRAESKMFKGWGADVIGMTVVPECVLARESQMCYASIATVTDYDAWKEGKAVEMSEIIKTFNENIEKVKSLLGKTIEKIPKKRKCSCESALDSAVI